MLGVEVGACVGADEGPVGVKEGADVGRAAPDTHTCTTANVPVMPLFVDVDKPSYIIVPFRSNVLLPPQLNWPLFSAKLYCPATTGSPLASGLQLQFGVVMVVF